jgi:GTP-dependent phosphoenolpyruvate carboxykinase
VEELLRVDPADWSAEMDGTRQFFEKFDKQFPSELWHEHLQLQRRLDHVGAAQK